QLQFQSRPHLQSVCIYNYKSEFDMNSFSCFLALLASAPSIKDARCIIHSADLFKQGFMQNEHRLDLASKPVHMHVLCVCLTAVDENYTIASHQDVERIRQMMMHHDKQLCSFSMHLL